MIKLKAVLVTAILAIFPVVANATTIQIQIFDAMPKVFSANLIWEDTLSSGCISSPCLVSSTRVDIGRQESGVGLLNVEVPEGATRVCFNGYGGDILIVETTLYMKNGRRHITNRKGGNVESNGRSGCSLPQADINDAKIWRVFVE